MTPPDLEKSLRQVIATLAEAHMLADSNRVVAERLGGDRKRLSWARPVDQPTIHLEHASLAEYLEILKRRDYLVRFTDHSFVQMSFEFERNQLVKHRYAYIPCPIAIPEDEQEFVLELGGLEDYLLLISPDAFTDQMRLGGAFRFDYDKHASAPGHPVSHFTLFGNTPGLRQCRIPVFAPLSPWHFVAFLFQHFYSDWFREHKVLEHLKPHWFDRTLTAAEAQELHLDWRRE